MVKIAFWKSWSWSLRTTEIIPIFNERGLLLCIQRPSGTFESREIEISPPPEPPPGPKLPYKGAGQSWYQGVPISLHVEEDVLWITFGSRGYRRSLYKGTKKECDTLLQAVRQAWLEANQDGRSPRVSRSRPSVRQDGVARGPWGWLGGWGVAAVVAGVLLGGGAAGMSLYLKQGGASSLDLTSMSVDDVAAVGANPAAVRSMQDQLMVAMQSGQAKAKEMAGKFEEDHLSSLKAMGLQPGVSVQNAMTCLSSK